MKRLVSGIKPTGELTLGNYIGAIKQFVKLQNELVDTESFIFIADLHAITTPQDKQQLRKRVRDIAAMYIACGLDPNKVNLFVQSEVIEHALLGYIMESTAYIGEMERMIQYKDKTRKLARLKKNDLILSDPENIIIIARKNHDAFKNFTKGVNLKEIYNIPQKQEVDAKVYTSYVTEKLITDNDKKLVSLYIDTAIGPTKNSIIDAYEKTCIKYNHSINIIYNTYENQSKEIISLIEDYKSGTNSKTSLLTYPALMAADILLYDADIVPVGDDQKQHLELTKILATRFNHQYGETFVVPTGFTPELGAKIKNLQDPTKKMSKSDDDSTKSYILLQDDINQIKNKIKSAVTDSDTKIRFDEKNKPGISNLLTIYAALTEQSIPEIEQKYQNETSYAGFKTDLAEIVANHIGSIQIRYHALINSSELDDILDEGAKKASLIAKRKISKVLSRLGLQRKK